MAVALLQNSDQSALSTQSYNNKHRATHFPASHFTLPLPAVLIEHNPEEEIMSLRVRDTFELMYGDSVKREGDDLELESEHDQEIAGIGKKKRRPANLCISCPVCGGPAPDHVHFGGQCCYSCRAFFRRSSSRPISSFRCRSGKNDCIITSGIKSCIPCRLTKCLQIGMDPNLVRGKKSNRVKMELEDYEGEDENEEMLPPLTPVETQNTIEHRNLLKYRADILKYQGMCLQYQASLLEKEATKFSPPPGDLHMKPHQGFPLERYDTKVGTILGTERPGDQTEAPLDLTLKTSSLGARLHTQSEHMPRIFFSKFSTSNMKL